MDFQEQAIILKSKRMTQHARKD